jgi:hypothetical protein
VLVEDQYIEQVEYEVEHTYEKLQMANPMLLFHVNPHRNVFMTSSISVFGPELLLL